MNEIMSSLGNIKVKLRAKGQGGYSMQTLWLKQGKGHLSTHLKFINLREDPEIVKLRIISPLNLEKFIHYTSSPYPIPRDNKGKQTPGVVFNCKI